MDRIASRDNPRFKVWRKLADGGGGQVPAAQSPQCLLEGIHLCQEWLEQRGLPLSCLVTEAALADAEVAAIVARLTAEPGGSTRVFLLEARLQKALSALDHGKGLMFVVEIPRPRAPPRLLPKVPSLLLDRIQDPGNLGAILRSAAAAGCAAIFCSIGCASSWSPKVLRAGMGAQFQLDIHEHCDLAELLHAGLARGVEVCAMLPRAGNLLYAHDVREVSWLFGSEGQGLAPELLDPRVTLLAIPQPGRMESLNVAAATAICLFEQVRQRMQSV